MRVMAIDFGGKRIGVAVGELEFGVITPRPTLAATGTLKGDAAMIAKAAQSEEVQRILIGIPVNEEDNRMERICRTLGGHIEALGWTVDYVDEAFTSEEADNHLRNFDLKASERRKHRDGEAARLILERWLHEKAST